MHDKAKHQRALHAAVVTTTVILSALLTFTMQLQILNIGVMLYLGPFMIFLIHVTRMYKKHKVDVSNIFLIRPLLPVMFVCAIVMVAPLFLITVQPLLGSVFALAIQMAMMIYGLVVANWMYKIKNK